VHWGWSDHRSPARNEAISMKQAPLRGLRCRPGESVGMKSGVRLRFVIGPAPGPRGGRTLPSVRPISTNCQSGGSMSPRWVGCFAGTCADRDQVGHEEVS
jgi:hypothetical protein